VGARAKAGKQNIGHSKKESLSRQWKKKKQKNKKKQQQQQQLSSR